MTPPRSLGAGVNLGPREGADGEGTLHTAGREAPLVFRGLVWGLESGGCSNLLGSCHHSFKKGVPVPPQLERGSRGTKVQVQPYLQEAGGELGGGVGVGAGGTAVEGWGQASDILRVGGGTMQPGPERGEGLQGRGRAGAQVGAPSPRTARGPGSWRCTRGCSGRCTLIFLFILQLVSGHSPSGRGSRHFGGVGAVRLPEPCRLVCPSLQRWEQGLCLGGWGSRTSGVEFAAVQER